MTLFDGGWIAAVLLLLAQQQVLSTNPSEIPDNKLTPGVVAEDGHDEANVCGKVDGLTYSKQHRHTPIGLKEFIRRRDGCETPPYSEVDHRCPLALGCADVVYNLWCQPGRNVTWNYHDKDRLEDYAYQQVCIHHTMSLDQAQSIFLAPNDWRVEYCKVFPDDERCKSLNVTGNGWQPGDPPNVMPDLKQSQ